MPCIAMQTVFFFCNTSRVRLSGLCGNGVISLLFVCVCVALFFIVFICVEQLCAYCKWWLQSAFQQSVTGKSNAVAYLFISFTMFMLSSMYFHFHFNRIVLVLSQHFHIVVYMQSSQSRLLKLSHSHVWLVYYLDGRFQRVEYLLQLQGILPWNRVAFAFNISNEIEIETEKESAFCYHHFTQDKRSPRNSLATVRI